MLFSRTLQTMAKFRIISDVKDLLLWPCENDWKLSKPWFQNFQGRLTLTGLNPGLAALLRRKSPSVHMDDIRDYFMTEQMAYVLELNGIQVFDSMGMICMIVIETSCIYKKNLFSFYFFLIGMGKPVSQIFFFKSNYWCFKRILTLLNATFCFPIVLNIDYWFGELNIMKTVEKIYKKWLIVN